MSTLYFITSNKGKVHETVEKFSPLGIKVKQKNLGYPEIQTDHLEDVAKYGVTHIQKQGIDRPFILEDAGLFIDGLMGFPGVYSSYVYHTIGLNGILSLLDGIPKRSAVFKSVFAYGEPSGEPSLFIGTCMGEITMVKKGSKGFGYDPIFSPDGSDKTFAQMDTKMKNQVSHRGKSLEQLYEFLKKTV